MNAEELEKGRFFFFSWLTKWNESEFQNVEEFENKEICWIFVKETSGASRLERKKGKITRLFLRRNEEEHQVFNNE